MFILANQPKNAEDICRFTRPYLPGTKFVIPWMLLSASVSFCIYKNKGSLWVIKKNKRFFPIYYVCFGHSGIKNIHGCSIFIYL